MFCGNCGTEMEETKTFCRECGALLHPPGDEAPTWRLPETSPVAEPQRATSPVRTTPTAPPEAPFPTYDQPVVYQPPYPASYQPPVHEARGNISLGDWLSGGWQVYKENALLMSLATLLATILSFCTAGVMAGPLLMGLYRMAFKTMRGDRPQMSDLFNWEGKFLKGFLSFLFFAAIYAGFSAARGSEILAIIGLMVVNPFLTIMLAFVLPLIVERNADIGPAITTVGRMIFSREKFTWWLVGFIFFVINLGGAALCGAGALVTIPLVVSTAAVAYRSLFGIDDPNRTMP
jgi:hypothetical protein